MKEFGGDYTRDNAIADFAQCFMGLTSDHLIEMTYVDKKRMHNLKYFTWVEQVFLVMPLLSQFLQQGKNFEELNQQWFDNSYWDERIGEKKIKSLDEQIMRFNRMTGMAQKYGME